MVNITLEEGVDQIKVLFTDGFQAKDIWDAIPIAMEMVESVGGLTGPEKKEKVLLIAEKLMDDVDLPGWDWLTKKAILWALPSLIDKLCDAAKGVYSF